jgi:hypothetical protein
MINASASGVTDIQAGDGIQVTVTNPAQPVVSAFIGPSAGLYINGGDKNWIGVGTGNGINIDGSGNVAVKNGDGIGFDGSDLTTRLGAGLKFDSGDIAIQTGTGITVDTFNNLKNTGVLSTSAGTGISVDNTDVQNPIIANTGVLTTTAGTGISVDNTDPHNPIITNTGLVTLLPGNGINIGGLYTSTGTVNVLTGAGIGINGSNEVVFIPGTGLSIDTNNFVNNTGVLSVTGTSVNNTDPHNPVINSMGVTSISSAYDQTLSVVNPTTTPILTNTSPGYWSYVIFSPGPFSIFTPFWEGPYYGINLLARLRVTVVGGGGGGGAGRFINAPSVTRGVPGAGGGSGQTVVKEFMIGNPNTPKYVAGYTFKGYVGKGGNGALVSPSTGSDASVTNATDGEASYVLNDRFSYSGSSNTPILNASGGKAGGSAGNIGSIFLPVNGGDGECGGGGGGIGGSGGAGLCVGQDQGGMDSDGNLYGGAGGGFGIGGNGQYGGGGGGCIGGFGGSIVHSDTTYYDPNGMAGSNGTGGGGGAGIVPVVNSYNNYPNGYNGRGGNGGDGCVIIELFYQFRAPIYV